MHHIATLDGIVAGGPQSAWEAIGFRVEDGRFTTGGVTVVVAEGESGLLGWSVAPWAQEGAPGDTLDGIPVLPTPHPGRSSHPSGVTAVDHVVVVTPDIERTSTAFEARGLVSRRTRDGELGGRPVRQRFFLLGRAVAEVVGPPEPDGTGPASLWGLAFVVPDLDALADRYNAVGPPRRAVQPGRRIATVGRNAGLPCAVAFLTPRAE